MYKKILVAVALDHAHATGEAIAIARSLAADDADILALHVIEEIPSYAVSQVPSELLDQRKPEAEAELRIELGDADGIQPVVVVGHAGRTIVEYASRNDVDCVVLSSHRPGFQDYFLGSTAQRVVRHAACSVHVLRRPRIGSQYKTTTE